MANILVCDDERSICEMLDIALRREGHKIETVNSGEAAKRKIDGALYDLIIKTDFVLFPKLDHNRLDFLESRQRLSDREHVRR